MKWTRIIGFAAAVACAAVGGVAGAEEEGREGDAGGAKGYLFPRIRLYGLKEGEKELRWTWGEQALNGPGEEDSAPECTIREVTVSWDFEEIGGVGYWLCSFEQQLLLEICEKNASGVWDPVASHSLGKLFDLGFSGDITFDGKIEEEADGVRVVVRRWDGTHDGEAEVWRFPRWEGGIVKREE